MLVFALLTLQFIKIWLVVALFYVPLIPGYSKRNMYSLVASCKTRYLERKKRVNVEQSKINKYEIRETEIAFSYY